MKFNEDYYFDFNDFTFKIKRKPDTVYFGMTPKEMGEIMAKNAMEIAKKELDRVFGSVK